MFLKIFKINFAILFFTSFVYSEVINDIQINGNKRISNESIIVFGEIDFEKNYNRDDLNDILKKIFETDFFKEVNLDIKKSTLFINLVENPIIENLKINGINNSKLSNLILNKVSLKERKSFIDSVFMSDLNLIKQIVKTNGYYFSEIETKSILNEEQNSIELIYNIKLGKKAKINEIKFLGDKKVKKRILKNIITSEETRFWKFISQSVFLNKDRINLDKRLLTNYYKDNGFYNVNITDSFVEFKDDGAFKLIFNIDAGNKFNFNKLNLILSDDYDPKYFEAITTALKKLENEEYSLSKIEKVLREVDKIAASKQYEFIDASLSQQIVGNSKLNIEISLVDTEKFYVEKINIIGNEYTLEEVVRNYFIVDEGDPYNKILFNKSVNRIKSKNIFGRVEPKILPGSSPNLKIINLEVEEKPTGELSLGAGISTSGGSLGGGIKEKNFLGKGIMLDTNLQVTADSLKGQFIYEQPNFNYSDNSLFTSLSSTNSDKMDDFGYKTSDLSFSLGTSFEQYEDFLFSPKISTSYEKLTTTSSATSILKKQEGNYFDMYFKYSLDYDRRNKRYRADEGFRNIFYQELPLLSNSYEMINSYDTTRYQKMYGINTKLSFYGKSVNTLNDENVRVSKGLYIPSSKLRGFQSGKVGPFQNTDYVGGNYVSTVNFHATLPKLLPSFENTDLSFFIDAANIWGVDYDSDLDKNNKIRSATGLALDVFTPIGPLNFSFSQVISKSSTDATETFRFNLGTTF